ncbi:MAG TPA: hypothetical protein VEW08_01255, partial [Steroidobacteraceae bacterium]|nr:hypothetical protein [Steroidobacteraceae bacterium]
SAGSSIRPQPVCCLARRSRRSARRNGLTIGVSRALADRLPNVPGVPLKVTAGTIAGEQINLALVLGTPGP